jgi:hypothetical protein
MSRVLLLYAATSDPAAAIRLELGDDDPGTALGGARVTLISWHAPAQPPEGIEEVVVLSKRPAPLDRVFAATGVRALRDRLNTFPIGRLLVSLGPADASRAFWRALRRLPLESGADAAIAVAGDLAAARAAWHLLRRGTVVRAVLGIRAALGPVR